MAKRSIAALWLMAAGLLPGAVLAAPVAGGPQVEQCDGSFVSGSVTRKPSPQIRAPMQDSTDGLKIGEQPPKQFSVGTRGMFRFDTPLIRVDQGCTGAFVRRQNYLLFDLINLSTTTGSMVAGVCQYTGAACDNTMTLAAGATRMPVGFGTCPPNPVGAVGATASVAVSSAGRFGFGANFDGATMYASSTPSTAWDMPNSYALSAWIRTSNAATQYVYSNDDLTNFVALGTQGDCIRRRDSRESPAGERDKLICPGTDVTDGNWHYVAAVRVNGVHWRYFLDGLVISTSVAVSTLSFSPTIFSTNPALGNRINDEIFIGSRRGTADFFNGDVDELRIQGGAISDNTILLDYNAAAHRFSQNGGATFNAVMFNSPYSPNPYNPAATNGTTAALFYQPTVYANVTTSQVYEFFAASSRTAATASSGLYSVSVDKTPPGAVTVSASPTGPFDINWTWSAPATVCGPPEFTPLYRLFNSTSGTIVATIPNGFSYAENFPLDPPNQIHTRSMTVSDLWGTSPLSNHATAYTLAAAPTGLAATLITTGSVNLSWNANGNPAYTRFEVTYSPDNFAATTSTAADIGDDYTATSIAIPGLAAGTNYNFRVRAFNGRSTDFFGGLPTGFNTTAAITNPLPPTLSGVALSQTSILWSWTAATGASGYRLYRNGGAPLLVDTPLTSFTESSLSTNTAYGAEVEAYNASGNSLRSAPAFVFTHASTPTAAAVASVSTHSIGYSWNANGNPALTFYEVNVATDAAFGVVVATKSGAQTALVVTGLFPASTYYARLRSFSGGQIANAFVLIGSTRTDVNPAVGQATAPASAYSNTPGLAGVWHFDESTGTVALDSSGAGLHGVLTCLGAACASTPTYAAGPPNLGTAVRFLGVPDSLMRVPNPAPLNFPGSVTVAAWAKPASAVQPFGAGVLAKGDGGDEAFALDVFNGQYRFLVRTVTPATIVVAATSSIRVGEWDHVAGVYDIPNSIAHIYVNGVLSNSVGTAAANRVVNAHDFAVGSRQSGSASYDLGFNGAVDDPRVVNGALTAPQIQQEYAGGFPGSVALPGLAGHSVVFPPNAFGAPAQVFASGDPVSNPIRVSLSALLDGLSKPPTGQILIPGSLVEIVPTVGGLPFTATLGSSATLVLPFSDSNGDGLIDGLSPPVSVGTLQVYTLNTAVIRWEALPTTIDPVSRRVLALTPHFSVFALFGATSIGATLSEILVYPQPWRVGAGDRFDAPALTFERLPAEGTIRILTLAGQKVRELRFAGPDAGRKLWDGRNEHGHAVASGVYFVVIKGANGATAVKKVAIER